MTTIKFYRQTLFQAGKINHILPYRMLTAEFVTTHLAVT